MSSSHHNTTSNIEGKKATGVEKCATLIRELKLEDLRIFLRENRVTLNTPVEVNFNNGCYSCRYRYLLSYVPGFRFDIAEDEYEGRLEKEKGMIQFLINQGAKIAYECEKLNPNNTARFERYMKFHDTMDLITACMVNYRGDLIEWIGDVWLGELRKFIEHHADYYWGKFNEEAYVNYSPLSSLRVDKCLRDRVRKEMARSVYSMFLMGLPLFDEEVSRGLRTSTTSYSIMTSFLSFDVEILNILIRERHISKYTHVGESGGFLEYTMVSDMEEPFRFLVRNGFKFSDVGVGLEELNFDVASDKDRVVNRGVKYGKIMDDMTLSGEAGSVKLEEVDCDLLPMTPIDDYTIGDMNNLRKVMADMTTSFRDITGMDYRDSHVNNVHKSSLSTPNDYHNYDDYYDWGHYNDHTDYDDCGDCGDCDECHQHMIWRDDKKEKKEEGRKDGKRMEDNIRNRENSKSRVNEIPINNHPSYLTVSEWGGFSYICPRETPDDPPCGLMKSIDIGINIKPASYADKVKGVSQTENKNELEKPKKRKRVRGSSKK